MASIPGVYIETAKPIADYSPAQIRMVASLAWVLQRGLFVLTVEPEGDHD